MMNVDEDEWKNAPATMSLGQLFLCALNEDQLEDETMFPLGSKIDVWLAITALFRKVRRDR